MKLPFKTLWSEFKAFAFKGNMIDLAVAVVIGAAFSGVIKALVDDIIMPAVSYGVTAASEVKHAASTVTEKATSVVGLATQPATAPSTEPSTLPATQPAVAAVAPPPPPAPAKAADAPPEKPVDFTWTVGRFKVGNFIAELLNFVIIAFAVFIIIVKLLGSVMKRAGGAPKPDEPTTKECPECLSIIPIRAKRCAHCTAVLPAAL